MSQPDVAARFRALHAPGNILVLPNAWDAASARIAEDCGAKAIATSSAAVAWAHGYADGEKLPKEILISAVAEIVRAVKIPVSADSEAGFSDDPAAVGDFVAALAGAGAVGINLEDGTQPPELLAAKITAIKQACTRGSFETFVNARTDVYLKALVSPENALDESIARGKRYRDAGADGLFVPGLTDVSVLRKIAGSIDLPLNAMTLRRLSHVGVLKEAGVRRVSAGAGMARAALGAMRRAASEMMNEGRYDAMYDEAEGCPNMNALLGG